MPCNTAVLLTNSDRLRKQLARIKRKLFRKKFIKDERYPAYWIDLQLGQQDAFLVQIGSNDGKTGDPFYELLQKNKHWKALLVEPIPYFFQQLQQHYPDASRFKLENVAINQGECLPFYWVDPLAQQQLPDLAYWAVQLGSFDKAHILKELGAKIEPFILSQELEGITVQQLLDRNQVQSIDILHIDAEGYDWKILSQLDLNQYQPQFILFEYHHLSTEELALAKAFLQEQYELFDMGIDLLAVSQNSAQGIISSMKTKMKTAL